MPEAPFIGLRPYGQLDLDLLEAVSEHLREVFPFPVTILEAAPQPWFAFQASRGQYLSKDILEDLDQHAPEGCLRILGLTEVDLFIPILTYVYGEAMLPGRAAVVSTARLATDAADNPVSFDLLAERLIKEAVHELGHTFNLTHCDDPACVMSFAHHLNHVDQKGAYFCRYCAVLFADALRQVS